MSRRLTMLSFGLGAWAFLSVVRAMSLAGNLAAQGTSTTGAVWFEAAVWLAPVAIGGLLAVLAVSRPGEEIDVYLARNVRLGVMVAIFAVLLSWALVLFAAYLSTLRPA